MIASETSPVSKAFSSAPVSIISPREVLMITGFRFSDWKKASSARWQVLYLPSLYKGAWKVSMSHSLASVCRDEKPCFPSLSSRGRSFSKTRIPNSCATFATLLPTLPTPIMPIVTSGKLIPFSACSKIKDDCRYWATEAELQPGAFVHVMPASRQYSASIWSKPMVAVAINLTLLPSSNSRLQRVRVRIISASASFTKEGVKSFPGA